MANSIMVIAKAATQRGRMLVFAQPGSKRLAPATGPDG